MICPYCEKEIQDDFRYCPACGKVIQEIEGSVSDKSCPEGQIASNACRRKTVIGLLIIIAAVCLLFVGGWGVAEYSKTVKYNSAVEKYEAGDYLEAESLFLSLSGYKDSSMYLTMCLYNRAIQNFENKEYDQAIEAFSSLGDYKDAETYLKKAVVGRKYIEYNVNVDLDPLFYELVQTPEAVEEEMSNRMFGEWFDMESNEKFVINHDQINNRPYGVNYAAYIPGASMIVNFYYLDDPQNNYDIIDGYEEFYYIEECISTLSISQTSSESGESYTFCAIPIEEYNALAEQDARIAAQQQTYSDDKIIQETLSAFQSKVGGYYSGASKLYHAVDYSNEYVAYDWSTKTYTCTFTGEYCTNIFDFYGTSTQTYFVRAEYVDTGADLVMISFSMN